MRSECGLLQASLFVSHFCSAMTTALLLSFVVSGACKDSRLWICKFWLFYPSVSRRWRRNGRSLAGVQKSVIVYWFCGAYSSSSEWSVAFWRCGRWIWNRLSLFAVLLFLCIRAGVIDSWKYSELKKCCLSIRGWIRIFFRDLAKLDYNVILLNLSDANGQEKKDNTRWSPKQHQYLWLAHRSDLLSYCFWR